MENKKIISFSKPVQRIEWLDILRGILIILMVFGHNIQFGSGDVVYYEQLYFENVVFRFIYSFHMPCLMIISGYLLNYSIERKRFWRSKAKSLLIPTLLWSTVPTVLNLVRVIVKTGIGMDEVITVLTTLICYYWFLWSILFCTVVIWLNHRFFNDNVMLMAVLGIVFMMLPEFLNTRLWFFSYPYFAVGYVWGG